MTDHWLKTALTNDVPVAELLIHLKHSSDSYLKSTPITKTLPPRWGHRKYRSKPTASTTTAATKGGKEHRGSPTTHLSWSGGGGGSSSDGYDESCRRSDLAKVNEGASTSNYHKFEKRRLSRNEQELTSMRVSLSQQLSNCENLKRIKVNLDQNQRNKMTLPAQSIQKSCRVEAETMNPHKGFVLPDLNMMPNEDDMAMMMN
ncbi:uncharacterized protein LOC143626942 isoform X2 [Bidens hawaiensis]|uniref:uncharacterized protein LOC143626942 isoform X2 n=1 Tax=Bidens hawaiensis TaxID=980011 RepID=UPI004049F037